MKFQSVFCITSGRSGTSYLYHMLSLFDGCLTLHEPERCILRYGYPLQDLNNGDPKLADIYWAMHFDKNKERAKKGGCKVLVETDFIFLTLWSDLAIRNIPDLKIIDLRRELAKVAHSFYRHGYFRGRRWTGNYLLVPSLKNNLTIPPENYSDFEMSMWFVFEIEARKKAFREKYPHVPIFIFDMEDKSEKLYEDLAIFLELEMNEKLRMQIRKDPVYNLMKDYRTDIDLEEARKLISEYTVIYKEKNYGH